MKRVLILCLSLSLLVGTLSGCNSETADISSLDSTAPQSSAEDMVPDDSEDDSEPEHPVPIAGEYESPIPDMETFIQLHNEAAELLGGSLLDIDNISELVWGGADPIEGGFAYYDGYQSGLFMFEPEYIRITGRMSNQDANILDYAAVAAAVTGVSTGEALEAMADLVENVEEDTWTNGYEVNLNEVVLGGVLFSIEIGRADDMAQFWVNPDGLSISLEKNGN